MASRTAFVDARHSAECVATANCVNRYKLRNQSENVGSFSFSVRTSNVLWSFYGLVKVKSILCYHIRCLWPRAHSLRLSDCRQHRNRTNQRNPSMKIEHSNLNTWCIHLNGVITDYVRYLLPDRSCKRQNCFHASQLWFWTLVFLSSLHWSQRRC